MRRAFHWLGSLLLSSALAACAEPRFPTRDGGVDSGTPPVDADTSATDGPAEEVKDASDDNDAAQDGQTLVPDAQGMQSDGGVACGAVLCAHGGRCVSDTCQCSAGWTGSGCEVDVDECQTGSAVCPSEFACENLAGGYTCAGYRADFVLPARLSPDGVDYRDYGWERSVSGKTVFDPATGLRWQREVSPVDSTFEQAEAYCQSSMLDGYSDWRLPSAVELSTLLHGTTLKSLQPYSQLFDLHTIWTLSLAPLTNRRMVLLDVDGEAIDPVPIEPQANSVRVRCVRREQVKCVVPPQQRLREDVALVRDECTKLTWERRPVNEARSYEQAATYCRELKLDGRSFRLPRFNELMSITDTLQTTALPPQFITYQEAYYWSSTQTSSAPVNGQLASYAVLNPNGGTQYSDYMTWNNHKAHVRCVSDGL